MEDDPEWWEDERDGEDELEWREAWELLRLMLEMLSSGLTVLDILTVG